MPTQEQERLFYEYAVRGRTWEYPVEIAAEFDRLNTEIERLKSKIAELEEIIEIVGRAVQPPTGVTVRVKYD